MLLLPLSTARAARAARAIACVNHSMQSCRFSQKEFYRKKVVFRHLNMDFTIFLILSYSN